MKRFRKLIAFTCLIVFCFLLGGCKTNEPKQMEGKSLEFTVLKESEIPAEVLKYIDEKKANEFKFTFYDQDKKDYLYIAVGYGKQPTGGYSIAVENLYLTDNSIYIDTSLVGPAKDDVVTQAITYPYIVVKLEYMDKPVTFI